MEITLQVLGGDKCRDNVTNVRRRYMYIEIIMNPLLQINNQENAKQITVLKLNYFSVLGVVRMLCTDTCCRIRG